MAGDVLTPPRECVGGGGGGVSVDVCLGHDNWGDFRLGKAEWVHMGDGLRAVLCSVQTLKCQG